jgi:hypothetical protein
MTIELWAFDAREGEAVVWYAGHWYRLCQTRRWFPEDLGDLQPGWISEPRFVRVRKTYSGFPGLAADLEAVCRAGLDSEMAVRSRLRFSREPAEKDRQVAWRQNLPYLIHLYQGSLDQMFARRGCTPEESFSLILETFRRLFLLGPLDGREIEERLPLLAADACSSHHTRLNISTTDDV